MTTIPTTRPADLVLAERVRYLTVKDDIGGTLRSITELALDSTASDHASITLIESDGTLSTTAATDEVAKQADALQYELHEGPCLTAAENGGHYVIPDTGTDPRWSKWGPAVHDRLGIRSVLSVHLFTADRMLGALNLYDSTARSYTDEEIVACRVVAAHASVALARLRTEQDLWRAVDSRHLIGQAQGILMERFSINPEQSFAVLRRYSQNHNLKLNTVAAQLVSTGSLPGDGEQAAEKEDA
ncbi:MAG: GAF and ANTAR domain-containing protein [Actinomycetota bacterium]|nr:GAF and ANTAR domain-containing protein [Actinomycetota bacterium]